VKQGTKSVQSAGCESSFTVRPWEPPTLTCDASPMTIHPDENSTITLTGRSPQNLPLIYECHTDAGPLVMNGSTATLSGIGMKEGPVTINCSVKDDKGHSANCNASVTVKVPPPPNPHVKLICSIEFSRDTQRPTRVDNEAKACLDEVALALQQHPDANLVIVGEAATTQGEDIATFGAQRGVNTKDYLTTEKGIDAARIVVVTGGEGTQSAEQYLVPPGAVFTADVQNTSQVDEGVVKPQEREPRPVRPHEAQKHAAAKSPTGKKKPTAGTPPPTQGP
jgi:hypothetical protein